MNHYFYYSLVVSDYRCNKAYSCKKKNNMYLFIFSIYVCRKQNSPPTDGLKRVCTCGKLLLLTFLLTNFNPI